MIILNKTEALERYHKKIPQCQSVVERMMSWDKNITISENARKLGMDVSVMRAWARRYGMRCRSTRGRGKSPISVKEQAYIDLHRTCGWPFEKIGHLFSTSRQNIHETMNHALEKIERDEV